MSVIPVRRLPLQQYINPKMVFCAMQTRRTSQLRPDRVFQPIVIYVLHPAPYVAGPLHAAFSTPLHCTALRSDSHSTDDDVRSQWPAVDRRRFARRFAPIRSMRAAAARDVSAGEDGWNRIEWNGMDAEKDGAAPPIRL